MDMILDQEGVEVDPRDRIDRDTPLHQAVRFVNGRIREEWEEAKALPELLLDAGADPRSVVHTPDAIMLSPSEVADVRCPISERYRVRQDSQ